MIHLNEYIFKTVYLPSSPFSSSSTLLSYWHLFGISKSLGFGLRFFNQYGTPRNITANNIVKNVWSAIQSMCNRRWKSRVLNTLGPRNYQFSYCEILGN